jgi:hypothetical protein
MIDIGVALTWAALSAASIKGLTVLARAAAKGEQDGEVSFAAGEVSLALPGLRSIGAPPRRPEPVKILSASGDARAAYSDASSRARARP